MRKTLLQRTMFYSALKGRGSSLETVHGTFLVNVRYTTTKIRLLRFLRMIGLWTATQGVDVFTLQSPSLNSEKEEILVMQFPEEMRNQ